MFFIKRLMPFYVFGMIIALIFTGIVMGFEPEKFDWSGEALLKTGAVLFLTTSISLLYLLIPYVIYLWLRPSSGQNSRADQIAATVFLGIFVFIVVIKAAASYLFWDEFSAAFNFIAVDYLVYTNEVISNIFQSYPMFKILLGLAVLTIGISLFMRKFLMVEIEAPGFVKRTSHVLIYGLICVAAYVGVDITRLEPNKNFYNNEIAKEGFYSLFSAFLKNELPYERFYLMAEERENLKLLQQKLGGKNIAFTSPQNNITRRITASGSEKRANVIIVLMESMSAEFMDENRPQGSKIITPNLSKLAREGIYFPNTYASGTRSVRGIEALTLGVPPLPGMSIVRRENNENLYNIGSVFRDKGYQNKWIYGGYGYFDNMNYFFEHNGFEVVDRGVWSKDEVSFANAWGACDEDTYEKVIKEANQSYQSGKPFLTLLLTISNHRPYTYPAGKIDLKSGFARREGGVKYADYAIGKFIEKAKKQLWFDNTVFVFVADHTAGAAGSEEINLEGHHIPAIIYAPKMWWPRRIETAVWQGDIIPTLLGLLNFDYESRFYGQDIFKPEYESRFMVSNYQKLGYVKNGVNVILKPVREFSVVPENADINTRDENLREAIAFYQQASGWSANLKE